MTKTLIAFYSYSGHSKALALACAAKESAEILEIRDIERPGTIKAYTAGCYAAMRGKAWPIQPLGVDLSEFARVILFAPVWAGNPPPAVHAFFGLLPEKITVSVNMVSASGRCGCKGKLEAALQARGCTLEGFENLKA